MVQRDPNTPAAKTPAGETPTAPAGSGPAGLGRRQLLQTGGLTIALGAVLAACGSSSEAGEPGRVGYAPAATPLPQLTVDDAVRMRTATSIEYTIIDMYGRITESGALNETDQRFVDRLVQDHQAAADVTARLTIGAGGEPYGCVNSWYMTRVVPPIFEHIDGNEAAGIPPSDNPARDMIAVVNAMESMAASMYQGMVETLTSPQLRAEGMAIGAQSARHAAAAAIRSTGAPEGYFSPVLTGGAVAPGEDGLIPLYAIPSQFGSLAPVQLVIGAPNEAGSRFTMPIETPAANSFVYAGETCDTA